MTALLDSDLDRLAKQFREPQVAREQLSVPIANVPETDDSDKRRYRVGIDSIDSGGLGAFLPGGFTVIGARQGHGKTALAETIALHNAMKQSVTFVSLEMTSEDIRDRMLARIMQCSLSELELQRRHKGRAYDAAVSALFDLRLNVWHPSPGARKDFDTIKFIAESDDADLIIVDYTRCIDGWIPGTGGPFKIVEQFSQYAKESRRHVILLSQMNRDAQGKRPIASQLQDCGRLEQEAEKLILLWRPFSGTPQQDKVCEFIVAKNRRGPEFRAHVGWFGPTTTFHSLTDDEEEEMESRCCAKK